MEHTEKTGNPAVKKDAALRITSPTSDMEQESKSVAQNVVRNGQITGNSQASNDLIGGNAASFNDLLAADAAREQIDSTKGLGEKLPPVVAGMIKGHPEGKNEIRLHTDSTANTLAQSMKAKAFTHGKDIYFAQGAYNTYTSEGREIIAHELQHTFQNTGQYQDNIQRLETADTAYGTFEEVWVKPHKYYDPPENKKFPIYSMGMYLKFKANDLVNAKSIGLVQIAKEYETGSKGTEIQYGDSARRKHAIQSGDAKNDSLLQENEEGFHVDRGKGEMNPLYAVTKADLGQSLEEGETGEPVTRCDQGSIEAWCGAGKHGEHWSEKDGTLHDSPAELRDFPEFAIKEGNEAGAVFEVAALALDGPDKGRYYGSVKWGYTVDAAGTQTPIALTMVSRGAASTTFIKAAEMWNADVDKKSKSKVIPLPELKTYKLNVASADFYSGAQFSEGGKITVQQPLRLEKLKTDMLPPDTHTELVFVRILEGDMAGSMGWMDGTLLKQEDTAITKPE